ncbi:hypothetical protein QAD02_017888 [Eretmocerus hayati]|uniref:Uncharacterized protein n=1 Tax=Eretmocerus hayati TaxID=131215 RepID=A0ACC2PGE5_9HYME|nr:hypothetical protein QAD02_017888 [Eretmocerus hayati]
MNPREQPDILRRIVRNLLESINTPNIMEREELLRLIQTIPQVTEGVSLAAPIMNMEITRRLSATLVAKDRYFEHSQTILGSTISETASIINLLSNVLPSLDIDLSSRVIQSLFNILKLSIDLRRKLTLVRKESASQDFDNRTKGILRHADTSTFLFGDLSNLAWRN